MSDMLGLRNAANNAEDLRRPVNLQEQVQAELVELLTVPAW